MIGFHLMASVPDRRYSVRVFFGLLFLFRYDHTQDSYRTPHRYRILLMIH